MEPDMDSYLDDGLGADEGFFQNASATYEMLSMRPPSVPLEFEQARVGEAERVEARVLNPFTQVVLEVSNIVYEILPGDRPPERAYWIGRKLVDCIYGCVRVCTVLNFRNDAQVPWEITEEKAAVKVLSWQRIRDLRHAEDPIKEISALQHVSRDGQHPNVMGALDVLQDDEYLLIFMPYCSSGSLYDFVSRAGVFPERVARYWFRQILEGLTHLQRVGVCHRDMSLENIVVEDYTRSVVIDLGMCLRVPYSDDATGGDVDVTQGTMRRLICNSGSCGKLWYMSPEVLKNEEPFDGFAIDLWGAAVVLFIMLVGRPPWPFASHQAPEFRLVALGEIPSAPVENLNECGVGRLVLSMGREISPSAADLLQRMLTEDPRQRLSLIDVQDHPWINDQDAEEEADQDPDEDWRNTTMDTDD